MHQSCLLYCDFSGGKDFAQTTQENVASSILAGRLLTVDCWRLDQIGVESKMEYIFGMETESYVKNHMQYVKQEDHDPPDPKFQWLVLAM